MKRKYRNKETRKFRSKLEETCWNLLTEANIDFFYEPFKIPICQGLTYQEDSWEKVGKNYELQKKNVLGVKYIPDFVSHSSFDKVTWLIETKGFLTPVSRLKWKLFKQWLINNNYKWTLFMPTNRNEIEQSIKVILKK